MIKVTLKVSQQPFSYHLMHICWILQKTGITCSYNSRSQIQLRCSTWMLIPQFYNELHYTRVYLQFWTKNVHLPLVLQQVQSHKAPLYPSTATPSPFLVTSTPKKNITPKSFVSLLVLVSMCWHLVYKTQYLFILHNVFVLLCVMLVNADQ